MTAVAYKSATEELILTMTLSADFVPAFDNYVIDIPPGDFVRPAGLIIRDSYEADPRLWIVAKNSIRMMNVKTGEI